MSEELCDNCVLNYWAGFIDGEGSICIVRYSPHIVANGKIYYCYQLVVSISNNCKFILKEIQNAFGGSLVPMYQRCWILSLNSYDAIELLEVLLPFLQVKKEQAKLGIEFQKTKVGRGYVMTDDIEEQHESYYQKMRELNAIYGNVRSREENEF